mmetsp:Transcript_6784/g.18329  ORF Transcript_6784/g.18329 Transcript_6784/m.18329 type:complete len:216 (+) Transcript_6784:619-1266(+)
MRLRGGVWVCDRGGAHVSRRNLTASATRLARHCVPAHHGPGHAHRSGARPRALHGHTVTVALHSRARVLPCCASAAPPVMAPRIPPLVRDGWHGGARGGHPHAASRHAHRRPPAPGGALLHGGGVRRGELCWASHWAAQSRPQSSGQPPRPPWHAEPSRPSQRPLRLGRAPQHEGRWSPVTHAREPALRPKPAPAHGPCCRPHVRAAMVWHQQCL